MMLSFPSFRQRLAGDPRMARVLHSGVTALSGAVLAVLVNIITLPLTLHYLGKLEYGVWVTISTSVLMLSVLDLGIANTLTNLIAEAYAEDDRQKAQQYFATAFWITLAVVLLLAPLGYLVWRAVDWGFLFHLQDPIHVAHATQCVGIAALFFLLSLPLALGGRVLGGYQQAHIAKYFSMGSSVLSLSAILLTILLKGSIVQLMLAYCFATLLGPLSLNVWLCLWNRPWLRPSPSSIQRKVMRLLFGQGLLFFILQLTVLVVLNSDNLVIAHYLGAAAVTPYSTAWRLTQYAASLQALLTPSLWPAFSEAYHKRHMDWIVKTYRSIQRKTLISVGLACVLLASFGRPLIRFWAGDAAVPSQRLLWLMAAFAFVMTVTSTQALLLTATGRLHLETSVAVLAAVSNLLLSIWLVQRIGPEGVILSTLLSFLVFMLVPQQWEVNRVLAGSYLPPLDLGPGKITIPYGTG